VSSLMGLKERDDSGAESLLDKFSPCHTRSGRIYTSVEKKKDASVGHYPTGPASKLPTPGKGYTCSSTNAIFSLKFSFFKFFLTRLGLPVITPVAPP